MSQNNPLRSIFQNHLIQVTHNTLKIVRKYWKLKFIMHITRFGITTVIVQISSIQERNLFWISFRIKCRLTRSDKLIFRQVVIFNQVFVKSKASLAGRRVEWAQLQLKMITQNNMEQIRKYQKTFSLQDKKPSKYIIW